jgi:hypothetical protein
MGRRIRRSARAYLRGASNILDISGQGVRNTRTAGPPANVDYDAVRSDWLAVGQDLRSTARAITARVR